MAEQKEGPSLAAARELRYNSRSAVYGDLAYDLDREVRERALRHAGEAPRHQTAVEAVPKAKPRVRSLSKAQVRQRQKVSVLSVLGVGAAIGLAVMVLMGYIQLTAVTGSISDLQEQGSQLEDQRVSLVMDYERTFDMAKIKEAAEAAGMKKPTSGQVEYLELPSSDSAVVYRGDAGTALENIVDSIAAAVSSVVEYFR